MTDTPLMVSMVFAALLVVTTLTQLGLLVRQTRHVATHRDQVPAAFVGTVSVPEHQKAADYTLAKTRIATVEILLQAAVLMAWTLMGGLNWLNQALMPLLGVGMGQQLALVAAFALVSMLIDLPLSAYRTFRLEARFGFNRTRPRDWLVDLLKGLVVSAVVGLPLIALLLALMNHATQGWWLWAWASLMGFNLLLMVLFPTVIAPLFNTFAPLSDDQLVQRVSALMARCGFKAKGIFVMDGSRRSAHGNAYFTGLGHAKRVVFYDTLLALLTPDEVEAVLAHELGHFHHKHLIRRLLTMAAVTFAGFALLAWLSDQTAFYTGLGVTPNPLGNNHGLALLLAMLGLPLLGFFASPFWASQSRRDEFEADRFAGTHAKASALASALLKLHQDNASTLTPDPWYVWFHYSHPPAASRLKRLQTA
ncbi:MAG: M48 family metallopeptidase [Hydrogenophaga sp.]|uniref:M48 family metallopeptidase n=1 Tax=Hydrogenophaga sp. TaxID=1904254 RepID=UPI00274E927A|nr:M48 family metallopeptidase [Hydrogenophaga sp.]MDP3423737.1 M48 family metallopeptidase [Burkholderiaceae bacterium]MDZ4190137.1 M48 family metallopeptidase [Hydrogenophaga sp.]